MGLYLEAYTTVLKKNFMVLIMLTVLLIVMFAFWVGIPFFLLGNLLFDFNIPNSLKLFIITVCIAILFTSFFIPINWKVAIEVKKLKHQSKLKAFTYLQLLFILISSFIFYLLFNIII